MTRRRPTAAAAQTLKRARAAGEAVGSWRSAPPDVYGTAISGDDLAPTVPDGGVAIFDRFAPVRPGDVGLLFWKRGKTPAGERGRGLYRFPQGFPSYMPDRVVCQVLPDGATFSLRAELVDAVHRLIGPGEEIAPGRFALDERAILAELERRQAEGRRERARNAARARWMKAGKAGATHA
jgi:hypothetical protein